MSLMAIHAGRGCSVFGVTGGAVHGAVEALELVELDFLLLMAGQAGCGEILGQTEFKRGMGVGMTFQASFQLVMAFSAVALAALRNYFHDVGRMSGMTIYAGYAGFMGAAFFLNIFGGLGVAFNTVAVGQSWRLSCGWCGLDIFIGCPGVCGKPDC
jgi:hypothetical protein